MNTRIRLKFKGSGLKQEDTTPFTPKNVVNLFIVYELDRWLRDANISLTLKYRFFEAVKLSMLIQINTNRVVMIKELIHGQNFHLQMEAMGKNVIFGADMSSSVPVDNKGKYISILGGGPP